MKSFKNLLLIAGTGRNVGKTLFACEIISYLSNFTEVIGIKIAPHLHPVELGQMLIFKSDNFQIIEELLDTQKDSSRMKRAGAKKVYYIQSKQEYLELAFTKLSEILPKVAIVCESGGLHQIIKPALFFLVVGNEIPANKTQYLDHSPIQIIYLNQIQNFDISQINFQNKSYTLNINQNE